MLIFIHYFTIYWEIYMPLRSPSEHLYREGHGASVKLGAILSPAKVSAWPKSA